MNKFYKVGLVSVLFFIFLLLVFMSGVSAADPDTVDLTTNDMVGDYGCGAVAFQTVLKDKGVNITLEEATRDTDTVNGSTSMQGLIKGAEKYNLSAVGVDMEAENLKTDYIVHMDIEDNSHWAVIEDVTDQVELNNLTDDLILPLDEFQKYYTNQAVIISNEPITDVNGSVLTVNECEDVIAGYNFLNSIKKNYKKHINTLKKHTHKKKHKVNKWYKQTRVKKARQYRIKNWKLQHRDFSLKETYAYRKNPHNPCKTDKKLIHREYGGSFWSDNIIDK